MKKITLSLTLILAISILFSCQDKTKKVEQPKKVETKTEPQVDLVAVGKALFTSKTCTTCHNVDTKLVGPAVQTIATTYKEKEGDFLKFFKGENTAIVDPAMAAVMAANVQAITKQMSDADLNALAAYIKSTIK
ncbi:MAG: c-type cytochrome [Flavobacteriaceae bacterium]|nr:c-type cytochrome [Flavobacteriaceae bacterium]